jgi:hypothetical protein
LIEFAVCSGKSLLHDGEKHILSPIPMNLRFLMLACFVTACTFAGDAPKLPSAPTEPVSRKKERLFR